MRGFLAAIGVCTLLLLVSQPVAARAQRDVLRPFATLPAGLNAEGLAIHEGHFYVGAISFTGSSGSVLVFDREGSLTRTLTVPGFPVVGQVAFHEDEDKDEDEDLFVVACTAFAPDASGAVVRVDIESGLATTVATEPTCPNGLAIDKHGNMFITNIFAGTVGKVTPDGSLSTFSSDPLLAAAPVDGFTIGPNDLTFNKARTALFVTNAGQGTVVKIEVNHDGTAGPVSQYASGIPSPDGLAFDKKGNLYVTSPFGEAIWLVAPGGSASVLQVDTSAESFHEPTNVAFRGHNLYITNAAFASSGPSKILVMTVQFAGIAFDD